MFDCSSKFFCTYRSDAADIINVSAEVITLPEYKRGPLFCWCHRNDSSQTHLAPWREATFRKFIFPSKSRKDPQDQSANYEQCVDSPSLKTQWATCTTIYYLRCKMKHDSAVAWPTALFILKLISACSVAWEKLDVMRFDAASQVGDVWWPIFIWYYSGIVLYVSTKCADMTCLAKISSYTWINIPYNIF